MAVDVERIRKAPLFASLDDDQLTAVAARFEERGVEAGRHLTSEHGAGYFFFVIDTGTADVSHVDGVVSPPSARATSSARPRSSARCAAPPP